MIYALIFFTLLIAVRLGWNMAEGNREGTFTNLLALVLLSASIVAALTN